MKTVIFLETAKSGSSRDAIQASEDLGYYTVLFTNRSSFLDKREEFQNVHHMRMVNLNDLNEIRKEIQLLLLKGLKICAIISFVDPYCHTASLLAEEYNVDRFSTEAIEKIGNKVYSREILASTPFAPRFWVISDHSSLDQYLQEIENYLPVVAKAPQSTGSKDVILVEKTEQLTGAVTGFLNQYPGEPVIVEEYLPEPQYLVEAVVYHENVHIVAVFKQDIQFKKRFIITGYSLLLNMSDEFYEPLKTAVESIIRYHGLRNGPCHLELRGKDQTWKLIEINPRISGAGMNRMIEMGFGIDLVKETLKMALGKVPDLKRKYERHIYSHYVTSEKRGILAKVTGQKKAKKFPGVLEVYVKPRKGAILRPPTSMGHRYAYVIATGETEEEAINNAKEAAAQIHFSLLPTDTKEDLHAEN